MTRPLTSILAILALVGCPAPADDTADPGEAAAVRVVHASPDAPEVDVWIAGVDAPAFEGVRYGDATAYADLAAGTYTLELRAAGSDGTSAAAYTQELTVPETGEVTVIAAGLLGGSGDSAFRLLPFAEDFETPATDTARVRIVHASATAPSVALDVGNDGTPEIASLARYDDTGVAGVELPADAALQIGIWTTDLSTRVTAFTTPALPDGGELFVIATGLLEDRAREDSGFSLLAVGDTGSIGFVRQNPRVYALHAAEAPAVDIFAGDAELVDDIAFGEISGAIQVPPGSYTLDFFATAAGANRPSGDPAASADTPSLAAGESYMAIASGYLSPPTMDDPAFGLIPVAEAFDLDDPDALVRVVHAGPNAPPVDVGTVAAGTVTAVADWTDLAFGESSDAAGTSLPAGTYDLGVAATGTTGALFEFSGLSLAGGDQFYAVAAGTVGTDFQILLVDAADGWTVTPVSPDPAR